MALPKHVVLKSNYNGKYVRYVHESGEAHGCLRCAGEEVLSPYVKLAVESAKCGEGMIHLRSCYNNKYFVMKEHSLWTSATAKRPEEDKSAPAKCTLFRPDFIQNDGANTVLRLFNVALGFNACLWRVGPPYDDCLYMGYSVPDKSSCDVFTVIDWDSLAILPRHVAFKGYNGYYLRAGWREKHQYLQFDCGEITNWGVWNTANTMPDGKVRIKSDYFGKFWRRSPNWIWADSDDTTANNPDTVFSLVKVDQNTIALINNGNNYYCISLTTEGKTDCLNAQVPNKCGEALLRIEEAVKSREIYDVRFRVDDARIYGERPVTMATTVSVNNTLEKTTEEMKLAYTTKKSRAWNSSVSLKLGVKTTVDAGVPVIASGGIEISSEVATSVGWGEAVETSTDLSVTHTVTVAPRTETTVSLIATRGSYDVPFSYTQCDTLLNGDRVVCQMDDGLFTGVEAYKFHIETSDQKIDP